jgi:FkbM family methyltransferase
MDKARIKVAFEIGSRDARDAVAIRDFYGPTQVYCMECNPEAVALCKKTLAGEDNISLVEKAAWRESGPLTFYPVVKSYRDGHEERNIGASSCFPESGDYVHREKFIQEEITVDAVRLDELCCELAVPAIDLICMDVQGAALQVLQGLGEKLKDTSYIITELEVSPVYEGQSLFPEVAEYLRGHGFQEMAQDMQFPEYGDFLFVNEKAVSAI